MQFAESLVIDWYDGIVRALVRLQGKSPWYYTSLLFYDIDKKLRLFAIASIDDCSIKSFEELRNLLSVQQLSSEVSEEHWELILENERQLILTLSGSVSLAIQDRQGGLAVIEATCPIASIQERLGLEIDAAVEPLAERTWSHFIQGH